MTVAITITVLLAIGFCPLLLPGSGNVNRLPTEDEIRRRPKPPPAPPTTRFTSPCKSCGATGQLRVCNYCGVAAFPPRPDPSPTHWC